MAPTTRKRKASGETSDAEKPAAAKTAKPPAKRPTRGKAKKDDEDARDEGRASSRGFFQAAKSSKKRRINVNGAKGEIQDGVDEIMGFMDDEQKKKHPVVDLGDALRQHVPPECAPVMAPGYAGTPNSSGRAFLNENFKKASQILGQLKETIELYKALASCRDNAIAKPDWMHWEQDQRDLKDLNQYAMTTAARTINHLIIPNPKSPVSVLPKRASTVEKVAWEIFDNVRPKRMDTTWGRIAQEQVRAFTGILRSMQEG